MNEDFTFREPHDLRNPPLSEPLRELPFENAAGVSRSPEPERHYPHPTTPLDGPPPGMKARVWPANTNCFSPGVLWIATTLPITIWSGNMVITSWYDRWARPRCIQTGVMDALRYEITDIDSTQTPTQVIVWNVVGDFTAIPVPPPNLGNVVFPNGILNNAGTVSVLPAFGTAVNVTRNWTTTPVPQPGNPYLALRNEGPGSWSFRSGRDVGVGPLTAMSPHDALGFYTFQAFGSFADSAAEYQITFAPDAIMGEAIATSGPWVYARCNLDSGVMNTRSIVKDYATTGEYATLWEPADCPYNPVSAFDWYNRAPGPSDCLPFMYAGRSTSLTCRATLQQAFDAGSISIDLVAGTASPTYDFVILEFAFVRWTASAEIAYPNTPPYLPESFAGYGVRFRNQEPQLGPY